MTNTAYGLLQPVSHKMVIPQETSISGDTDLQTTLVQSYEWRSIGNAAVCQ